MKTTVFAVVGIGGDRHVNDRQRPSTRGRVTQEMELILQRRCWMAGDEGRRWRAS
jgi:hypothetical protein